MQEEGANWVMTNAAFAYRTGTDEECVICLEEFGKRLLCSGRCGHWFHAECLEKWLATQGQKECPVCRRTQ